MNAEPQRKLTTTAIVAIIGLLGLNGVLLWKNYTKTQTIQVQTTKLDEAEKLKEELNKQYFATLDTLNNIKSENAEMSTMLEKQKEELKSQKEKIASMISVKKDLVKAREMISQMSSQANQYLTEIDGLRNKNKELATANEQLSNQNAVLSTDLNKTKTERDELSTTKATLVSEKSALENENKNLSTRVLKASAINLDDIEVKGVAFTDKGKEKSKSKAADVEKIKVCYKTTNNENADVGKEKFYVRILSPSGETIGQETMGGGVMKNNEGQDMRYSFVHEIMYEKRKDQQDNCALWAPGVPLTKGIYKVEIYNKGHLTGSSLLKLK